MDQRVDKEVTILTQTPGASRAGPPRLCEMTVTLMDSWVDIDRRVLMPEWATLADLHLIIQAAMGWTDAHLHEFTSRDGTRYGVPVDDIDCIDESGVLVTDLLAKPGDALRYVYDFGDYWQHDVELVAMRTADGPPGAACIGGHGACPPEDCGGVSGYQNLCEVLADPTDPDHEELTEWVDGVLALPLDVHALDLGAANEAVQSAWGSISRTR